MSIKDWDQGGYEGLPLQTTQVRESCPYCAELIELVIDPSQGEHTYIEDCFVCCRPITVLVSLGGNSGGGFGGGSGEGLDPGSDESEVFVSLRQEDEV